MKTVYLFVIAVCLLATFFCPGCSEKENPVTPENVPADASIQQLDGKALINERCTRCHGADRIFAHQKVDEAHWTKTVDSMISKGAVLSGAERNAVIEFLTTQQGTGK